MTASVRIDGSALTDPRFAKLAKRVGLADGDHARGKLEHVWAYCTDRQLYFLPAEDFDLVAGVEGLAAAACLPEVGLAEETERGIRVRGTRGRIEWKKKLRDNAMKGGRQTAAKRRAEASQEASQTDAKRAPEVRPPSPSPSPSPSPVPERPGGGRAAARALALEAVGLLNQRTGAKYSADAKATVTDFEVIAREGFTLEQAKAVVEAKVAEWRDSADMAKNLRPSTLFRPSNFRRYVADAEGGKPSLFQPRPGNGMRPPAALGLAESLRPFPKPSGGSS